LVKFEIIATLEGMYALAILKRSFMDVQNFLFLLCKRVAFAGRKQAFLRQKIHPFA